MSADTDEQRNVVVFGPGEREAVGPTRILAQSPGAPIAFTESTVPPGFPGPVRHRHAHMYDIFYVLDGTLTLETEGETHALRPGAFAMVPPGIVHTFSNPGAEPTRFLNIYHPSGLEQYVKEVARRMGEGHPPSPQDMAEIAAPYDFEPVHDV